MSSAPDPSQFAKSANEFRSTHLQDSAIGFAGRTANNLHGVLQDRYSVFTLTSGLGRSVCLDKALAARPRL